MKKIKYLILICAMCVGVCTYAQDTIPTLTADTLTEEEIDSLILDSIARLDELYLSWVEQNLGMDDALAWVDDNECTGDSLPYDLPDSVFKARLQALPFIIEVPYNSVVRAFIIQYLKNPARLARLQRKAEYYFPIFEDQLAQHWLPDELKYLAVIESALNPRVYSRVGAAGLWQFMPATGKLYGLEVNSLVDERMDPIKATGAACRFLNSLYNLFCDWTLAIAAYNCGPGNINKAIHRSGGKRDFWSIYPYLPKETRSYVPIFIAASYAMNYADVHGVCPADPLLTMRTDTIMTNERIHLRQISDLLRIPMDELQRLNPQYVKDVLPGGKDYALTLPIEKTGMFIDMHDTIVSYKADELINNRRAEIELAQKSSGNGGYQINGVTIYKIKQGDTLGSIAKKFHVSVKQLRKWNNLKNDNIRAGKTLRIGG